MANTTFKAMRLTSVVICLIVVASFLVFAVNRTSEGSANQQVELGNASAATTAKAEGASRNKEGTLHKTLTDASNGLTSPFSGVISSNSEWATRGVKLLLALLVYGFGLGFLARMVRVRL
jgi:hypothetical protein